MLIVLYGGHTKVYVHSTFVEEQNGTPKYCAGRSIYNPKIKWYRCKTQIDDPRNDFAVHVYFFLPARNGAMR